MGGCSAQVKMVPISCASLVANVTGSKITRTSPFLHFVCIVLIILTATYPITLKKNKGTYITSVVSLPFNKT